MVSERAWEKKIKVETSRKSWALLWEKKLEKDKTPSRFLPKRKKKNRNELEKRMNKWIFCNRTDTLSTFNESASCKIECHSLLSKKLTKSICYRIVASKFWTLSAEILADKSADGALNIERLYIITLIHLYIYVIYTNVPF